VKPGRDSWTEVLVMRERLGRHGFHVGDDAPNLRQHHVAVAERIA
jgi:hypothetical protein